MAIRVSQTLPIFEEEKIIYSSFPDQLMQFRGFSKLEQKCHNLYRAEEQMPCCAMSRRFLCIQFLWCDSGVPASIRRRRMSVTCVCEFRCISTSRARACKLLIMQVFIPHPCSLWDRYRKCGGSLLISPNLCRNVCCTVTSMSRQRWYGRCAGSGL